MSQRRALVVDDEPELREAICDELSLENWQVEDAADGQAALEKMQASRFDVIISDIRMPRVDGLQLLQKIRSGNSQIIFILMSAYADIPIWESYANGAQAFFGKPFRIQDLEDLLVRMELPPEKRWSEAEKIRWQWQAVNHIEASATAGENFSLGSGGMFLDPGAHNVRKGQIISFHIKTSALLLKGMGRVLWKRGAGEGGMAPGLGIEFLFLEESCRQQVAQAIEKSQEKAFVPRGSLSA